MAVTEAEPVVKPANLPQYCSACFGQDSSIRHLDFNASCDRGWYGQDPATNIAMDDLIICENCWKAGAPILDYAPKSDYEERISSLEADNDRKERELKQARNYADTMEEALEKRRDKVHIDHRKKPRQLKED